MDLQEFEQSVFSVVTDKNSTDACKSGFEDNLACLLEERAPSYLENNLKKIVRRFESALIAAIEKPETDPSYRQKLQNLRFSIRSLSKTEIGEAAITVRRILRHNIPDLEEQDQQTLIDFGEAAMDSHDPEQLVLALRKIHQIPKPGPRLSRLFCNIANMLKDNCALEEGIRLLEKNLDDPFTMGKYVYLAKKALNREALKNALDKLEHNLESRLNLTLYAAVARILQDQHGISTAMRLLFPRHLDPSCMTSFAALAKDRGDPAEMAFALDRLEPHLNVPGCLSIYAALARRLDDNKAMEKAHKLLEGRIGGDFSCLTAYAKITMRVGDETSQQNAMSRLKEYLDENPGNIKLYLEMAEARK